MSLYRKYRPQTFSHLVGQNHVSQTLANALKLDRVNHAYLFTGPRGTGKTSTARLLAKAINCTNMQNAEPCNECDICIEISEGRLIDIIEIDAASNRGIDEIRDLREKINFAPTRAKSKVYIIDEVHMLTKEAFNALLKTLEEPPSHVYFVLATTEVHKIPETILSRCQRFDFKRIDDRVLMGRLRYIAGEEKIDAEDKALEVIVHHAEGGLRDAIGLLEQLTTDNTLTYDNVCSVLGVSGFTSLEKLYDFLRANNMQAALQEINELYMDGHDLVFFNKRFLEYLRRKMLTAIEMNDTAATEKIIQYIENFQQSYDHARYATIPQLPLEMAIVKSCPVEKETDRQSVSKTVPLPAEPPAQRVHKPISTPKSAVPSPEPAQKKSPELLTVKKQWGRIAEQIKSPIARRSFQQSVPLSTEGVKLLLAFSTEFHLSKMMEATNRQDIEHAIAEVLGTPMKISGEIRKLATEVNKELQKPEKEEATPEAGDASGSKNLAKEVLEMFEGELA